MCDSLRPSRRASFPSLGNTRRCACRFAPCGPARLTAGLGFVSRSPLPAQIRLETTRVSQGSWRTPIVSLPCSQTPAGPTHQALRCVDTAPVQRTTKATQRFGNFGAQSHGFDNWLSTLRPVGCPHRTQDSLPAAGQALPGGIGCPQGSNERFPNSLFPLSQASWRRR